MREKENEELRTQIKALKQLVSEAVSRGASIAP